MLKQRVAAAEAIAQTIRPAEAAIDIAAIEASRLVTVMMEARRKVGLTGGVGADALGLVSKAATMMIEAQALIHQAHEALGPVARSVGLAGREHMYGCEEPPPNGPGPSIYRVLFGADENAPISASEATG